MVLWDVVVVILTTSGHLEWASITIKYILFWKGLQQNLCVLVARAYLAIAKDTKVQQLVSSLLIDIHGSYRHRHTLPVLYQGLASQSSYGLGLLFGTLLGVHYVFLEEAGLGIF